MPCKQILKLGLVYPFVSQHNSSGEILTLPYSEFETVGLEAYERVLKTIWAHEGAGSMVYGLFRSDYSPALWCVSRLTVSRHSVTHRTGILGDYSSGAL